MRTLTLIITLLTLAGCETMQHSISQSAEESAIPPIMCVGKDQCDVYWARTQVWIAQNSRYKIQFATNAVIQTFTSEQHSADNHFMATREPLLNGNERIVLATGCGNIFGCSMDQRTARRSMYAFVTKTVVNQITDAPYGAEVIVDDLSQPAPQSTNSP